MLPDYNRIPKQTIHVRHYFISLSFFPPPLITFITLTGGQFVGYEDSRRDQVEPEAPHKILDTRPDGVWPSQGAIEFW